MKSIAFSPDGRTLATGTNEGVLLWGLGTHTLIEPELVGGNMPQLAFSPDGKTLVGSTERGITLWDVASRRPVGFAHTSGYGWRGITFSPDGKNLALGSTSKSVMLWQADATAWQQHACQLANRNLTCDEWDLHMSGETYRTTCPELPAPEKCR